MKNPDIDVSTFLKGASPSFQKYIEEGLAEIQRTSGTMGEGNTTPSTLTSQSSDNRLGKLSTSLHKKHVCQSALYLRPFFILFCYCYVSIYTDYTTYIHNTHISHRHAYELFGK